MSKRYYLCDIIGDGLDPETAFRPAIADYTGNFAVSIPTDSNGQPLGSSALTIVAALNHAALKEIPGVDQLPVFPLDGKVNGLNVAARQSLEDTIAKRGINVSVDNAAGYRSTLDALGKYIDPNFDIDNFDVSDV